MGAPAKKDEKAIFQCGLFSKHEAAQKILGGTRHLHSSTLGFRDVCAKITERALAGGEPGKYPWENPELAKSIVIGSAAERHGQLRDVVDAMNLKHDRKLHEGAAAVLEELISNAIYHSQRLVDGKRKYRRTEKAELSENEKITLLYFVNEDGVYFSVEDKGGTLDFEELSRSIHRCYEKKEDQILDSESGGGLGLYISFDRATHLRVDSWKNKKTVVSVWLAAKRAYDPDVFSFNFFERS